MTCCLQACMSCCGCESASDDYADFEDRATKAMRDLLARRNSSNARRSEQLELDLTYLTERIIALSFASDESEFSYRRSMKKVLEMVKGKYEDRFLLVNLSERRSDLTSQCRQIVEVGWPGDLAMPLDHINKICQLIDRWLTLNEKYVVVLHCKGGCGRLAVALLTYYNFASGRKNGNEPELNAFSIRRFYQNRLSLVTNPSQRRYIGYTRDALAGALTVHNNALYLHAMILYGIPNFNGKGGAKLFFKIYQQLICIHATDILAVDQDVQSLCVPLQPPLQLRGDILLCCYHKSKRAASRDTVFRCQFHTCAISSHERIFHKVQLDEANCDVRFPNEGRLELAFSWNGDTSIMLNRWTVENNRLQVTSTLSDAHGHDPVVRWDSFENFYKAQSNSYSLRAESGDGSGSRPGSGIGIGEGIPSASGSVQSLFDNVEPQLQPQPQLPSQLDSFARRPQPATPYSVGSRTRSVEATSPRYSRVDNNQPVTSGSKQGSRSYSQTPQLSRISAAPANAKYPARAYQLDY